MFWVIALNCQKNVLKSNNISLVRFWVVLPFALRVNLDPRRTQRESSSVCVQITGATEIANCTQNHEQTPRVWVCWPIMDNCWMKLVCNQWKNVNTGLINFLDYVVKLVTPKYNIESYMFIEFGAAFVVSLWFTPGFITRASPTTLGPEIRWSELTLGSRACACEKRCWIIG